MFNIFFFQKAKPVEDPLIKIREEKEATKSKEDDVDSKLPITERVSKSVIPYASLPYKEQVIHHVLVYKLQILVFLHHTLHVILLCAVDLKMDEFDES